MRKILGLLFAVFTLSFTAGMASAEDVPSRCDRYADQGPRHGLCMAFCDAKECDTVKPGEDPGCDRIAQKFSDASSRAGYKDTVIECAGIMQ